MVQIDDIKVVAANVVCMVIAQFETINGALQSILILATIAYTVMRTINEIKKWKHNGKTSSIPKTSEE